MLKIGGYFCIFIGIIQLAWLLVFDKVLISVGNWLSIFLDSQDLISFSYYFTLFIGIVFLLFGILGVLADNIFFNCKRGLIYGFASFLIFRGLFGIIVALFLPTHFQYSCFEMLRSSISIFIGLLYLFGAYSLTDVTDNKIEGFISNITGPKEYK